MDPDQDCTMCTLGAFCEPQLTPYQVFEVTDVMAGPAQSPTNVSIMVVKLGLGDGHYDVFDSLAMAEQTMQNSMMERFALMWAQPGVVGHMVNAYRIADRQTLTYLDYQVDSVHGAPTVPPANLFGASYFVWPIKDAD